MKSSKWPKKMPFLTQEQMRIRDDFMKYWLEVLPQKYNIIEKFNHNYVIKGYSDVCIKTLEIGAGSGTHLTFENLDCQDYTALELRNELALRISQKYPKIKVIIGDVQKGIDSPDNWYDRILAIHVLEHLPNLPLALKEIKRVLKYNGYFYAVIPCEGGFAYEIARSISAKHLFEKRYKCSYKWLVKSEHVNNVRELLDELRSHFKIKNKTYWPLFLPSIHLNLVIGLTCTID